METEPQAETTKVDIVDEIRKMFARLREIAKEMQEGGETIEWVVGSDNQ